MRNVQFAAGNFDFMLISFVVSQRAQLPPGFLTLKFAGDVDRANAAGTDFCRVAATPLAFTN